MMQGGSSGGSNFHKLLGRALVDNDFYDRLRNTETRADALFEMGIEPTEEVLGAVEEAMAAIDNLAQMPALGGGPQEVG